MFQVSRLFRVKIKFSTDTLEVNFGVKENGILAKLDFNFSKTLCGYGEGKVAIYNLNYNNLKKLANEKYFNIYIEVYYIDDLLFEGVCKSLKLHEQQSNKTDYVSTFEVMSGYKQEKKEGKTYKAGTSLKTMLLDLFPEATFEIGFESLVLNKNFLASGSYISIVDKLQRMYPILRSSTNHFTTMTGKAKSSLLFNVSKDLIANIPSVDNNNVKVELAYIQNLNIGDFIKLEYSKLLIANPVIKYKNVDKYVLCQVIVINISGDTYGNFRMAVEGVLVND